MPQVSHLEIIPLGGLGEFGLNLMVYRHGSDCIAVDAGLMFPGEEHFGVDIAVPRLDFLGSCGTLHGVLVSHGHEDHIGAIPELLGQFDVPVFAPPHAGELVRLKLGERAPGGRPSIRRLPTLDEPPLRLGPFEVSSLPVSHSTPQSRMILLDTPVGRVVHSADFKLDPDGWGEPGTDVQRLQAIGDRGVLALLSDSTNADLPGRTGSERSLLPALETLIRLCEGRVVVTMFSSNIERVANLAELAGRLGRKLAVVGSSVRGQVATAERLGLLRFPPRALVSAAQAMNLPANESLLVTTGSQGEPLSALARIAAGRHRDVEVSPGDLVIHSARVIPGSERRIGRMIDRLLELGAQVVTASHARVHVSGHAAREELRELTARLRPRYLIPIHGEYRQLHAHAALAVDAGFERERVLVARSGDCIVLNEREIRVADRVPAGRVMVDPQSRAIDPGLLDDRRRAAGAGVVVPVISLADERDATVPDIVAPGFALNGSLLREARQRLTTLLASGTSAERANPEWIRNRVEADLRSFLRRRTRREPLIVPLVVGPGG